VWGASEIYQGIEEKWYSLLDGLSANGVPVYKLIDPLENAGTGETLPMAPLVPNH